MAKRIFVSAVSIIFFTVLFEKIRKNNELLYWYLAMWNVHLKSSLSSNRNFELMNGRSIDEICCTSYLHIGYAAKYIR